MTKRKPRSKERLNALKSLVNQLSDRDVKIKRDVRLFEDFFENFPIPVTMWAVSREGAVVSQRGNGLVCEGATCLDTLFDGLAAKKDMIALHQKAIEGETVQKIIGAGDQKFYLSIIPRRNDSGEVTGAAGLAWNVTSNLTMIVLLEEIQKSSRDILGSELKDEDKIKKVKKILDATEEAIGSSRLVKWMEEQDV